MKDVKDCIYRKEATEFIDKCLNHEEELQSVERETLIAVKKYLESINAADMRPVVFCRDCKHNKGAKVWRFLDLDDVTADCSAGHGYPLLDWFCADGEKRLDNETT